MTEVALLPIPVLRGNSTWENIAGLFNSELQNVGVDLKRCLSFPLDNASVMTGKNKGVLAYIRKFQSEIVSVGCPCHLIHVAAKHTTAELSLKADDLLVDSFYYFKLSANRKQNLQSLQLVSNGEKKTILKHVATRWLSLEKALNRLLEEWNPLYKYFEKTVNDKQDQERKKQKQTDAPVPCVKQTPEQGKTVLKPTAPEPATPKPSSAAVDKSKHTSGKPSAGSGTNAKSTNETCSKGVLGKAASKHHSRHSSAKTREERILDELSSLPNMGYASPLPTLFWIQTFYL